MILGTITEPIKREEVEENVGSVIAIDWGTEDSR